MRIAGHELNDGLHLFVEIAVRHAEHGRIDDLRAGYELAYPACALGTVSLGRRGYGVHRTLPYQL
jgi:hypothetical protein